MTATALQSGMLFHAVAHPGTGVDIEQISMRIDERLDVDRFRSAWATVIERHPILRAHFNWADVDEPELRYGSSTEVDLHTEDWSSRPPESQEELIRSCLTADRLSDFDLGSGPLHRFVVAELGPESWWVLWSFHHSILDGRSFPIVLREVFELYDNGLDLPLAVRPDFQIYVDAIRDQDLSSARAYWTKRLEHFETASSIVVDSGAEIPAGSPSVLPDEIELGAERTGRLKHLAEAEEVSLNTCVQAAWFLLLGHYSQQPVITFGTTRACRHAVEGAADMVGLLINTVPMSVERDDDETVGGLLRRLRREQFELRDHETTPLPVIRECAPGSASELFESIVVFDDASLDARMDSAFPQTAATRHFRYDGQTNFPLTLLAYGDESMLLRLEGALDRYDRATIRRLLDQLINLLDGFVDDPGQRADAVPYLTPAEHDLYDQWNQTAVDYDLDTTLHALFEAQVERTPDAPALLRGDETLTYLQFNQAANQLAHHLRARGVGPGTGVGIFAERSFEMMVGVYATIKAGGAYVPLDPEHPVDRIRFMAEDSGINLILTQADLVASLPGGDVEAIVLDGGDPPWSSELMSNPEPVSGPDDMAYLLYTSGSTGRPKGAMIEHRAIVNRLLWMQEAYQLDETDCVLQKTPYTFDVSVWELFWPLEVGARLVMAEPGGHRDTAYLASIIAHYGVTTLHFVPSMLQLFVEEPTVGICASVKRVICSGEALPRSLQDRLFEVLDTELHNLYGPTEAAVDVTWWVCDPTSSLSTVPIGYPIANTEVHVLDPHLRRVPVGVQGELHIGGVQLARGYHNREELTAEKFIPDPFSVRSGARLYKTGDLVRHRTDGAVEFLGRIDHQVKIRGQRIELGEIEAVIADHPAVREVVVVASGPSVAETRLVAYVVAELDGAEAEPEQALRDHCSVGLAAYMVPTLWMFLDTFPLNPNGKVDRKALPTPEIAGREREIVAAGSTTEAAIADVWRSLLSQDEIGVTETFFDVGGNSLLLIRLAHLLTGRFDKPVSVQQLLRHTTIRQQAELIAAEAPEADEAVTAASEGVAARRGRRSNRRRRMET
ncbi:MAG: amino acid adenylation domain-containing protein [Actinomycetia bacterium]|nr:amino acid adenylation domain-containing protein [Actinomycetes bacterium]